MTKLEVNEYRLHLNIDRRSKNTSKFMKILLYIHI